MTIAETPLPLAPSPRATRWLLPLLLALTAGVTMFYRLGDFRTYGTHETFSVVPAREMLESGDFLVPYSGGLPRLRKPPLNYWLLAGTAMLVGEMSEWTTRLPAAVSAVFLSLLMMNWARRWYGPIAGWTAGFAQLTSAWVLNYGRKAEIDMLLCLVMTAAMFLVAHQREDEPRRTAFWRWTAIYGLLAISWMAKFHFGPALVLAPVVVFWMTQREPRRLFRLIHPLGWLLMAAAIGIWPYLVWREIPGALEIWQRETVGRALGKLDSQPIWFYLPYLFWLPLPWTPFVLRAIPASWRRAWREGDSRERFLWIWGFTHLAILHASANKHNHYLNPMMPVFTLWASQGVSNLATRWRQGTLRVHPVEAVGVSLLAIAGATAAAVIASRKMPDLQNVIIFICACGALATTACYGLLIARRYGSAGLTALAGFLTCYVAMMGWVLPAQDHRLQAATFAKHVRQTLGAEATVIGYQLEEHDPVVYYVGSPVLRVLDDETLIQLVAQRQNVPALGYRSAVSALRKRVKVRTVDELRLDPALPEPSHEPLVLVELTPRRKPYSPTGERSDLRLTQEATGSFRQ